MQFVDIPSARRRRLLTERTRFLVKWPGGEKRVAGMAAALELSSRKRNSRVWAIVETMDRFRHFDFDQLEELGMQMISSRVEVDEGFIIYVHPRTRVKLVLQFDRRTGEAETAVVFTRTGKRKVIQGPTIQSVLPTLATALGPPPLPR